MTAPRRSDPKLYRCSACRTPISKRTSRLCRACLGAEVMAGFKADLEKIAHLLDAGLSYSAIERQTGVTEDRIMRIMRRLGVPRRSRSKPAPKPDAPLQECGSPSCSSMVRGKRYCDERCRKVHRLAKLKSDRALVKRVINGELSVEQAADELGVTEHRVRQIRKDMLSGGGRRRGPPKAKPDEDELDPIANGLPGRLRAQRESDYIDWRLVSDDVP